MPDVSYEPLTKTLGVELSAAEVQEVSGADWWPDITISESDRPSLTVTVSAVEVTVEWD